MRRPVQRDRHPECRSGPPDALPRPAAPGGYGPGCGCRNPVTLCDLGIL